MLNRGNFEVLNISYNLMKVKGVLLKYLVSLMLLLSVGFANDISYSFHISNKAPYQNEAIFLDFNISQEDHSRVMRFKFTLKESDAYSFHQIEFKENDEYHHLKHHYMYLIYPKKVGKVALEFSMIKSLTDDDKVAYAISGDRDNVKGLVKKDSVEKLEPLLLEVKALPKGTALVGDYKLTYELDKTSTEAYDPVHLSVHLKGKGNIPTLKLLPKSKSYNLFTQAPKIKSFHNTKGTQNSIEWDYAISGKENFVLPKVLLKAFNPSSKKSYELLIPSQAITVIQVAKESLVDKEDTPSISSSTDWSWLGWLFSYLAVFVAGFLMPKDILERRWGKKSLLVIKDEVAEAKTDKELLKVLLARHDINDKEAIGLLEERIYRGKKVALSSIKKILVKGKSAK
jgi:hypothetical protein